MLELLTLAALTPDAPPSLPPAISLYECRVHYIGRPWLIRFPDNVPRLVCVTIENRYFLLKVEL